MGERRGARRGGVPEGGRLIARKGALAIANVVLGSVLGIVALFLIGRFFGPDANGEMTFAFAALGLLFFVTDLGMGQAHVKRVSEGRHAGDCFATYAAFKLTATAVFLLLAGGALGFYTLILGRSIEDTTPIALALAIVFYVAKAVQDIGQSSFEARVETAKAQLSSLLDTLVRVGLTALFAGFLAAGVSGIGPFAALARSGNVVVRWVVENPGGALSLATAAGGVAAASVALVLFLRIREKGRFRWSVLKDYWTFALPLFVTSTAGILATHVDGTALGLFLGKTDAGVFGAVRRIPLVLLGVGTAVAIVLFPSLSAMGARGDQDGIRRSMDQTLRYLTMLLLPIVVFILLFAETIIRLAIGAPFVSGAGALRVLSIYVLVATLAFAHGTLLMGLGHPGPAARVGLAYAALVVVLDLVLIPYDIRSLGIRLAGLGMLGAALGTLAAAFVWYGGLRHYSRRLLGYREPAYLWRHLAAAGLMALPLLLLDRSMPFERWFHVPLFVLVGGLAYLVALLVVRAITREDIDKILHAVHPIEMLRYAWREVRRKER